MSSTKKIQHLLVSHLLKYGQIEIKLPDGVVLEIGVTQEGENGRLEIKDDYCWLIATDTHKNRSASMDSFNMGLRFEDDKDIIVFEDRFLDDNGEPVRRLDVV